MKKRISTLLLLTLLICSCGWFRDKPEIAIVLSKHFDNKLYKQFDTAAYNPLFSKMLSDSIEDLANPKVISGFYRSNQNRPVLVARFYSTGELDSLKRYIASSKADGFNPQIFHLGELNELLELLSANDFKKIEEVYPIIAALELKAADAFLKYTTFIKYGSVNPKKIYNRYFINSKRPDSMGLDSLLSSQSLVGVLRAVQSTRLDYLSLKKQLARYRDSLKNENDTAIVKIKVNMERMRWQLPIRTAERILVNIPDFSLTWLKNADTLTHMKVCVGGKRENDYLLKMKTFLKSGKLDDKPRNHETPQLVSVFNAIQVNPIWNIPVSIAQSEIYYQALKDPYYLSNNNIMVYYKGKLVSDPDTIRWSRYPRAKLPFQFKQGSGEGNALGKFKFIFENSSSIYLHDTNYKNGFKLSNRAISHGCVRIENPLAFAELMVKDKYQYDELRMEVNLPPVDTNRNARYRKILAMKADTLKRFQLKPSWFSTRKNVSVIISYHTAWAENGKVEFRPDVYNYDDALWRAIKKYM